MAVNVSKQIDSQALEHFNIPSSRASALEVCTLNDNFFFESVHQGSSWKSFLLFIVKDSPSGLKAAVAAGLAVVGLTTRNPGQELIVAGV